MSKVDVIQTVLIDSNAKWTFVDFLHAYRVEELDELSVGKQKVMVRSKQ